MASAVDVFLRLIGDSRSAVRALDQTTEAAKRTDKAVDQVNTKSQQSLKSLAATASSIATQFGIAYAALSEAGQKASDVFQGLTGTTAKDMAASDKAVLNAGSTEQLVSSFNVNRSQHRGILAGLSRIWTAGSKRGAIGGLTESISVLGQQLSGGGTAEFDALYAADPARARALAAARPQWAGRLAQLEQSGSASFKQQLAKQYGGQTNITVNTVTAHLNDGESLRAMTQRAERNNGRSSTFTKP